MLRGGGEEAEEEGDEEMIRGPKRDAQQDGEKTSLFVLSVRSMHGSMERIVMMGKEDHEKKECVLMIK